MNSTALDAVDPGTAFSLAGALYVLLAIMAGIHVVLNKRNEASAFSWLGIIVLAPLLGAILYWLFGINRIKRRAQAELTDHSFRNLVSSSRYTTVPEAYTGRWQSLMQSGLKVHPEPYLTGNHLVPLQNGDETYPEMLLAIKQAKTSVVMSSYIFEFDAAGSRFVDALVAAHRRGVQVRVLIDGLGVGYGFSLVRSDRVLRRQGVKTARFLSTLSTTGTRFINLRNHRKILSVDGRVAFVGGMNIRQENLLAYPAIAPERHLTQDVHFCVRGPVINQINAVFKADWQFAMGEALELPIWHESESSGDTCSRVLVDGPDDNYEKLKLTMLSAINVARERIQIVSPYFLPSTSVYTALHLACLRGVTVDVCVPSRSNLPFVGWAMRANRRRLLDSGVSLYESPVPFDHSKLFLIDDFWCMVGSSNWDARSLELNFEINLECFDPVLNKQVATLVGRKIANSRPVPMTQRDPLLKQLRNNFFRLFSPYL